MSHHVSHTEGDWINCSRDDKSLKVLVMHPSARCYFEPDPRKEMMVRQNKIINKTKIDFHYNSKHLFCKETNYSLLGISERWILNIICISMHIYLRNYWTRVRRRFTYAIPYMSSWAKLKSPSTAFLSSTRDNRIMMET